MNQKPKTVQIPIETFLDLYMTYQGLYKGLPEDKQTETHERIRMALHEKIETMYKRDLYTKSKTGETEEERAKALAEYVESLGQH